MVGLIAERRERATRFVVAMARTAPALQDEGSMRTRQGLRRIETESSIPVASSIVITDEPP